LTLESEARQNLDVVNNLGLRQVSDIIYAVFILPFSVLGTALAI
jgi:hypothetical protein